MPTKPVRCAGEAMLFANAMQSRVPFAWYVAARIDVVFLSPPIDAALARPWARPKTLFVPSYQHYCGLNDRFAFGHPLVMRSYISSRLAMATERDICFQAAETHTCLIAKAQGWIVAEAPTRFLRVRNKLQVPKVDLATVSANLDASAAVRVKDELKTAEVLRQVTARKANSVPAGAAPSAQEIEERMDDFFARRRQELSLSRREEGEQPLATTA